MENTGISQSRNYGLDILKFISMVYVVILHSFGEGGIIDGCSGFRLVIALLAFFWTSSAVDIFALVTGYVSYTDVYKPLNRKRIFDMWFQVVFYGLVITAVFNLFFPDKVKPSNYFISVFPLFNNEYWYYTSYFLVYLISPFINSAIRNSSELLMKKSLIIVIVFFSIFVVFANSLSIEQSLSFTWILMMYFIGAVLKKCHIGEKVSSVKLIIGIIVCNIFIWDWYTFLPDISFGNISWTGGMMSDYDSPVVLMSAICHLLLFRKIKVGPKAAKIICFFSPCVFATYLINANPLFYYKFMDNCFEPLLGLNIFVLSLIVVMGAVVFTICSCLIDKIRILLFRLVRIDKLTKILVIISDKILYKLIRLTK